MNILATQHGQRVLIRANCPEFEDARAIIAALASEGVTYACVQEGTRPERVVAEVSAEEREAMGELVGRIAG